MINEFEVTNPDPNRIEPTLTGYGEMGYCREQFDFRLLVEEAMLENEHGKIYLNDSDEKVEELNFQDEVCIFGSYVTVYDVLFRDILEKVLM